MSNPIPSVITKVNYIDNHDGDTVTVEVRRQFPVRIKDVDAFELKQPLGPSGQAFVHNELSNAKEIILVVPTNDPLKLMDVNSFERVVGEIWYDGKCLKDEIYKNGFAKPKTNK